MKITNFSELTGNLQDALSGLPTAANMFYGVFLAVGVVLVVGIL